MNPPCSRSTLRSVPLHQGLQMCLHFLSPLEINQVWILFGYSDEWFSIGKFRFRPPPYCWRLGNLYYPVHHNLLNFFISSLDSMQQTLHSRKQCLCTILFHHRIILCIFRCTWKLPHCLITPVIEWMQSQHCSHLKFKSNSRIHCNLPAQIVFSLLLMGLIKYPKTPLPVSELAIT